MFSFKGFTTQDRNTHLEHLEDDIINRGSKCVFFSFVIKPLKLNIFPSFIP